MNVSHAFFHESYKANPCVYMNVQGACVYVSQNDGVEGMQLPPMLESIFGSSGERKLQSKGRRGQRMKPQNENNRLLGVNY
jgi:hypothetical protein